MISHRGQVAHDSLYVARDVEADRPVKEDTIFRIYSMSKVVTGVADQATQDIHVDSVVPCTALLTEQGNAAESFDQVFKGRV